MKKTDFINLYNNKIKDLISTFKDRYAFTIVTDNVNSIIISDNLNIISINKVNGFISLELSCTCSINFLEDIIALSNCFYTLTKVVNNG